jgi:hypothetical protein
MEPAPTVGEVFFPLDEKVGLQPGSLTPLQMSYLVHFGSFHSFEQAAQMLESHHGVQVSASTARRQTEAIGACAEVVQDEQAKAVLQQDSAVSGGSAMKQAMSSDGSFVSLRRKVYAEVKTAVIGEVEENKHRSKQRPDQEVKMTNITYFSRMASAEMFTDLSIGETNRRGFLNAKHVCAVADGAEWIQHFIDAHRADAVRILDFYHATEYLSKIASLVREAGTKLEDTWLDEQCYELKHHGPKKVLEDIHHLLRDHPHIEELARSVNYLQKREQLMQYPLFQQKGWPIGSGSAESSHISVVQSRLKGPGMHWEGKNVNPMLALRTGICNERWEETRNHAFRHRLKIRAVTRFERQKKHYEKLKQNVKETLVRLLLGSSFHTPTPTGISVPSSQAERETQSSCAPHTKNTYRPAPSHPWRRYPHAKK